MFSLGRRHGSDSTAYFLFGLLISARGGHWLITPLRHPHATVWGYASTCLQVGIGLAMAIYGWVLRRRERTGEPTASTD